MTTIERKDLVNAVLASRDELDPDLETELLEAIVDAEAGCRRGRRSGDARHRRGRDRSDRTRGRQRSGT